MSSQTFEIIRGTVLTTLFVVAIIWFLWRWLKGSRDPAALFFRWVLTVVAIYFLARLGAWTRTEMEGGGMAAIMGAVGAAAGGLFLAFVWAPSIVEYISGRIGSLYDGGSAEVDPKPYYSIPRALKTKGKYYEALAEIRKQLDKFPTDFEGMILLAELQAENLNDLPGAGITIHRLCAQPGHAPANIAYALNKLVDWHLSLEKDRDAARAALEKIIELLPDTEMSLQASQRIARLADTESLLAGQQRQAKAMKKGVENLGLLWSQEHLKPTETDPAQVAAEYVKHLEEHPLDTHIREKLAGIYAGHYHRLDLALDQLDQLVQQPNHPPKQVVHWLNHMADLQIQEGAELEAIRATLQRIVDLYPNLAVAETTQRRIDTLKLELRPKEKSEAKQLGVYEQNIGLKPSHRA